MASLEDDLLSVPYSALSTCARTSAAKSGNYYGEGGSWLAYEDEFSNTGVVVDLESRDM